MDAKQVKELVELLTSRTRSGQLEWRRTMAIDTLGSDAYETSVAGMKVTLSRAGHMSGLGSTRIKVTAGSGAEILNVAEGEFVSDAATTLAALALPVRIGPELGKLFEAVKSRVNRSNHAIQGMIDELKKL